MIKLYFVKFLDTKEKLTEGRYYKLLQHGMKEWEGFPRWSKPKLFVGDNVDKLALLTNEKDIVVGKLFLCSRDIQVGDRVLHSDPSVLIKGYTFKVNEFNFDELKNKGIKIIGEISPEATWVKEGDEFNEDQIILEAWVKRDTWFKLCLLSEYKETISYELCEKWKCVARILGPCGHFH